MVFKRGSTVNEDYPKDYVLVVRVWKDHITGHKNVVSQAIKWSSLE